MVVALPMSGFKCMIADKLQYYVSIPCIWKADLEYQHNLHEIQSEYPLALDHLKIKS